MRDLTVSHVTLLQEVGGWGLACWVAVWLVDSDDRDWRPPANQRPASGLTEKQNTQTTHTQEEQEEEVKHTHTHMFVILS